MPSKRMGRPGRRQPAARRQSPRLVLVVAGSDDSREMYAQFLRLLGHRVVEGRTGAEALEKARSLRPDAIVMDLSLPLADGWGDTRRLKTEESTKTIPVVALITYDLTDSVLAAGVDVFLTKPFLPEDLAAALARVLS